MKEKSGRPEIHDDFWSLRLELNRNSALIYQWEQYEKCGTIQNFRIAAERGRFGRKGYFYTDSDLHKWADAAARSLKCGAHRELEERLDKYIDLVGKAMDDDGYLFTWNQIYFPGRRWENLQIEHELYTMGHFIEAGISHCEATGKRLLLDMVTKTADLVVRTFFCKRPGQTPGHQEIEIALCKLELIAGGRDYANLAAQFLNGRGKRRFFGFALLGEFVSHYRKIRKVKQSESRRAAGEMGFEFGENMQKEEPRFIMFRSFFSFLDGTYQQQHIPPVYQIEPKGHSVRWVYMMYALALAARSADSSGFSRLEKVWRHLIERKVYISGGIGSLPVIEGFGRDYELDNRYSYSETCASIGMVFWNDEMNRQSGEAPYADMVERQLYNGAAVGISMNGREYFYRNPLESDGRLVRHSWFDTACCPSNISRLWADIPEYIFFGNERSLYVNQYIGCCAEIRHETAGLVKLQMKSAFPWEGEAELSIDTERDLDLKLRIPGWSGKWQISVDGAIHSSGSNNPVETYTDLMQRAYYKRIAVPMGAHRVLVSFKMDILINRSDPRVLSNRGRAALSRGPLVYCLETDAPDEGVVDLTDTHFLMDRSLFDSPCGIIRAGDREFLPYFLWGNRGAKAMRVWIRES